MQTSYIVKVPILRLNQMFSFSCHNGIQVDRHYVQERLEYTVATYQFYFTRLTSTERSHWVKYEAQFRFERRSVVPLRFKARYSD